MSTAYQRRLAPLIIVLGFVLLCGVKIRSAISTSTPQTPQVGDDKPAGQVFKNVQVLKDIPASQLNLAMDFMAASLGVGCDFCHTGALDSDEKTTKLTTRKMIVMTADINKQSFSGFAVVNCYTCHRGRTEPASIPEIDGSLVPPGAESNESPSRLPAASVVIDKYETAIGGLEAINKVTTCVLTGSQTSYGPGNSRATAAIEIYHKMPDRFLYYTDLPAGPERRAFDGTSGWVMRGNEVRRLEGQDLARVERQSDFYEYLRLDNAFTSFRVLGSERLNASNVIVAGAVARDGAKVKLYFDARSGLLVRRAAQIKTPMGVLPDIIDFEDYRKVNGIQLPFRIKRSRPPTTVVLEFSEIRINAPIDESKFTAPQR